MSIYSTETINSLRHQARRVVRELGLLNDAFHDIGVTLAERHLLLELDSMDHHPTMKEIAEQLLLEKSTVSRLLAKAIKKGFVTLSVENRDRRKRYLQLTDCGKKTLHAFEEIAFSQTKNALLTLRPEEVRLVHAGVELYAKGLERSRQKTAAAQPALNMKIAPGFTLEHFLPKDEQALHALFQEVAGKDGYFPNESNSFDEFQSQFFAARSEVFVARSDTTDEVVAGFYLKPNFSGRGAHIANAAYMVAKNYRGKGLGTSLVEASLALAKTYGFRAMQYNMVLSNNTRALHLYKKLGFSIIGTIPEAIKNSDGSYQDGYILHKNLSTYKHGELDGYN